MITESLVIFPTFSEPRPRQKISLPPTNGRFFYFIVPQGSVLCAKILLLTQCILCVKALSFSLLCHWNRSSSVSEMRVTCRVAVASGVYCFLFPY